MSDFTVRPVRSDLLDDIKRLVIIVRTLDLRTSDNLDHNLVGTFLVSPHRHVVVNRSHIPTFYHDGFDILALKRYQLIYLRDSLWSHLAKHSIRAVLVSEPSRV